MLAACAVGPNYHAPETKTADRFDSLDATYSAQPGSANFWQTFADTTLDRLVNEALTSNHDLRIALTRVQEARALRRDAAFDLAPSINATGGYTRAKASGAVTAVGTPRETEFYDAGFDAFWELDFFGGVRRERSASSMRCQPRGARTCSRSSSPVFGSSRRTKRSFHCTSTRRPIQPGGAL